MIRHGIAVLVIAGCVVLGGCEQKASSFRNGQSEPGAGNGQRGGANDGTAAGGTGSASNAGGKDNGGASPVERSTADPRGNTGGKAGRKTN